MAVDDLVDEPDYADGSDPEDERPNSPWGYPMSWGSTSETTALAVTQIALTLTADAASARTVVTQSIATFPQWFDLLKDWVEVLTRQDLDPVAPRKRFELKGDRWAAWLGESELDVPHRFVVDFAYGEPLSESRWTSLLTLVGEGSQPPVEHLLLRDARAAHVRRQYRRSVVDAATALEISLHRLLLAEHRRAPSLLADEFVRSAERWSLGRLQNTLNRLGLVPAGVTADLVRLRNSVVHKTAHEPSEGESATMLTAATDAVNMATPVDAAL
ncbi:MAG TPA: hypothetical protein VNA57_00030 [Acidimicrobiales bacterium]|nr:hypothetical protein [Acidimicrobiales bacterium]